LDYFRKQSKHLKNYFCFRFLCVSRKAEGQNLIEGLILLFQIILK
jgi:hypothetical protein